MAGETQERRGAGAVIRRWVPIVEWLPAYQKSFLRGDVLGALTVWALLVPEGMAYASLAGVPLEAGLYIAPLAMLGYAIFGTSRHMTVGPSSTVAIMSAVVIAPLALGDPQRFIELSAMLALLVGAILVVSGLLRLGLLADFLSRPVLAGFVVGLGLTIVVGQLPKLFGFEGESGNFFEKLWYVITSLDETHAATLAVGASSLVLLWAIHKYTPKIPAALSVLVFMIAASAIFDFASHGIHTVGEIPGGLPSLGLPDGITTDNVWALLPGAVGIALVAFAESISIARTYASKGKYEVQPNSELVGLGFANAGAGLAQGFVVDGSLSRSTAAEGAGAKTQMASLINVPLLLITMVALLPLFKTLPEATLGAIVIHAVWHLVDLSKLKRLYGIKRNDFAAGMVAMLGVLAIGILAGVVLAVLVCILLLLWRARNPAMALLGKVPGVDVYRSLETYPDSETYPGLVILRFDADLFYVNALVFRDQVRDALAADPAARTVLVDAEGINDIDTTAIDTIEEMLADLKDAGVDLRFARMKAQVRDIVRRSGLEDEIGSDHFYPSVQTAVDACLKEQGGSQ